jgi:hypothetical protein
MRASAADVGMEHSNAAAHAEVLENASARMRSRARAKVEGLLLWRTSLMSAVKTEGESLGSRRWFFTARFAFDVLGDARLQRILFTEMLDRQNVILSWPVLLQAGWLPTHLGLRSWCSIRFGCITTDAVRVQLMMWLPKRSRI